MSRSALIGAARSLGGAALVTFWVAGAAAQISPRVAAPAPARQDTGWRATLRAMPRPFTHGRHEVLSCLGCHGSGATHRLTLVRSPRDCAACHHDPRREQACTYCHSPDSIPRARTVSLRLSLQVATSPRVRDVTFQHAVHIAGGSGLVCRDCHATEVTLARNRECGSCHASHHAGRATCSTCHVPPPSTAHNAAVHLTCSGGACHAPSKAPVPTLSREVCLFCHELRRTHEPGGACGVCHRIPGATDSVRKAAVAGGHRGPRR